VSICDALKIATASRFARKCGKQERIDSPWRSTKHRKVNCYFEASILQVPHYTGCQVYVIRILENLFRLAPDATFHLHFAMQGWHSEIDQLLESPNAIPHRHSGPVGRHLVPIANILRTGSNVYYLLNGNTGWLRVSVPCATIALFHDMRFVLCPQIYGEKYCSEFARDAKKWMPRRDRIVTVSESVKQEILEFSGLSEDRVVVAPNAPNIDEHTKIVRKPAALPEAARFFLMVNPSDIRKNWRLVLEGFELYLARSGDEETCLVMAGKLGANEEPLTTYLEQKPALKKRVRLLGFVSDAELCYLYRNARLMVYPSIYEGFGIPVVEAIANGAPAIVSDIPVFREVTNGAALFVPLDDPEALCEAYSKLENDSALRSTLVEDGKVQARRYSWERSAEITLEMLRDFRR
jgi:glycosyltransferase involved in cell wall biosynthesis